MADVTVYFRARPLPWIHRLNNIMAAAGPTPLPEPLPATTEGRSSLTAVVTAVAFSRARLRRRASVRKSSLQEGEEDERKVMDGGMPEASLSTLQSPVTGSRARFRRRQRSSLRETVSSMVSEEASENGADKRSEVVQEEVRERGAGEQPAAVTEGEGEALREEEREGGGSTVGDNVPDHQHDTTSEWNKQLRPDVRCVCVYVCVCVCVCDSCVGDGAWCGPTQSKTAPASAGGKGLLH